MFSGFIEERGTLRQIEEAGLVIAAQHILSDVAIKESVAVDGTCLTVTDIGKDWFRVDVMPKTLRCTRLASLQAGARVNLERSLPANGRIGGHMVQGHVEATVSVVATRPDGIGLDVEIELPGTNSSLCRAQGLYHPQWCQPDRRPCLVRPLLHFAHPLYPRTY